MKGKIASSACLTNPNAGVEETKTVQGPEQAIL